MVIEIRKVIPFVAIEKVARDWKESGRSFLELGLFFCIAPDHGCVGECTHTKNTLGCTVEVFPFTHRTFTLVKSVMVW